MPSTRSAPAGPSQPRRRRDQESESEDGDHQERSQAARRDEEADEPGEEGDDEGVSFDYRAVQVRAYIETQIEAKANKLVRYALFNEYKRKPLTRAEIMKESQYSSTTTMY
jgi:hypothetical protein